MCSKIYITRILSVLVVLGGLNATKAHAALGLAFSANGSVSSLSVAPGADLSIPIYLRQYSTDASHPSLNAAHGLNVFGVAGNLSGSGISFVDGSLRFEGPFADQGVLNPSTMTPSSFLMNGFDPRGGSPGLLGESILLGSITVYGSASGGMAMLMLRDPDATLDDFATSPNFGSFDAKVFENPPSVTITVVPEADTLVVAAVGLTSTLLIRRISRRGSRS